MIRFSNTLLLVAVLAAATALVAPMAARADFEVTVTDSVNTYHFSDGGTGEIDISIHDAAYSLIGTISTSNYPGTPTLAQLDINYTVSTQSTRAVSSPTGGLMTIAASANDFNQPNYNPLTLTNTLDGNGTGSGTITAQSYADTTNALFGTNVTSGQQGPFTIGNSYSSTATTQFNQVGDYSLTDVLTFNLGKNQNTSGDSQENVTPAPAPAGLLLVVSGLPVLSLGVWLRRRKSHLPGLAHA